MRKTAVRVACMLLAVVAGAVPVGGAGQVRAAEATCTTVVPRVLFWTFESAFAALTNGGFTVLTRGSGRWVVKQTPEPFAPVACGAFVEITLDTGTVPLVEELTITAANRVLADAGYHSRIMRQGKTVHRQDPPAGTELECNADVKPYLRPGPPN